jgi:hypothetical protein
MRVPSLVTTPYRNEVETLEARKRVLQSELESIEARIQERRRLPLLDQVKVASPCPAKWDDMIGDARKRLCLGCDKHVFDISALSREEAEQFLQDNAGGEVCLRYYQRADGTIMTSDCAVGVTRRRRKKVALAVAGAGALAFGAVTSYLRSEARVMGKMEMTGITSVPIEPPPMVAEPGTRGPTEAPLPPPLPIRR